MSHLQNVGYSPVTAGLLVGGYGIAQFVIRGVLGWLSDIIGRRRMYIASFVLQGLGFGVFAFVTYERPWLLPVYILLYGMGNAGTVVLSQTVVADYFGTRRYATLRGLSNTLSMPVGIIAPFVAGWMLDTTGSYTLIFVIYALVMMLGGVCILLIRRPEWNALPQRGDASAV